jgi:hypothetical protein
MQAAFPDDFLLFDITYKKIIINLVNVGVRKGRIMMFKRELGSGGDIS